ncbi:nickel/cobalt transporter [Tateyamaria sp.]|uniref:nickel/cobalt transporter n=1 Tax=Tateyamaria sp. TaxID=1929288 RepID=UPI00329D6ABE
MRFLRIGVVLAAAGVLLWLFGFGGMADLSRWANGQQRETQNALAQGLRAVRAGEAGAWATLMGLCAAYGFFHAVGPGHGKLVIGGYGAAARVTAWRLSGLALASSLAQALAAILLVGAGALVLGWSRTQMTDAADKILAPASFIAIALVGAWLLIRGARRAYSTFAVHSHDHAHEHAHAHDHSHGHAHAHSIDADGNCETCGHAHAPTVEQVEAVTSWRDAAAIVFSIAIRPCTGAVFLLILCFALGIPWAGIAGALVMGLGTASVTILVAIAAVSARTSVLSGFSGEGTVRAMALIEVVAGGLIALVATALALPLL